MRKVMLGFVIVVLTAVVVAVGSRASDDDNPKIVHIQEHVINATYVPVYTLVGGAGPLSQGDYIAFDDPIFDPQTGEQIGHDSGVCTLVDVAAQMYTCPDVTFILTGRGEIAAGGLADGTGNPTTGPILGGTGEFHGATGSVRLQILDGGAVDDFVFTLSK